MKSKHSWMSHEIRRNSLLRNILYFYYIKIYIVNNMPYSVIWVYHNTTFQSIRYDIVIFILETFDYIFFYNDIKVKTIFPRLENKLLTFRLGRPSIIIVLFLYATKKKKRDEKSMACQSKCDISLLMFFSLDSFLAWNILLFFLFHVWQALESFWPLCINKVYSVYKDRGIFFTRCHGYKSEN